MKDKDLTGWVVQIPEDDSASLCPERIINAAYEFNTTPKGQRMPVETIGDLRSRYSKIFREQNIWIKPVPVLAVTTANRIPMVNIES